MGHSSRPSHSVAAPLRTQQPRRLRRRQELALPALPLPLCVLPPRQSPPPPRRLGRRPPHRGPSTYPRHPPARPSWPSGPLPAPSSSAAAGDRGRPPQRVSHGTRLWIAWALARSDPAASGCRFLSRGWGARLDLTALLGGSCRSLGSVVGIAGLVGCDQTRENRRLWLVARMELPVRRL